MTQIMPKTTSSTAGKWKPYPAYKDSGVEWLGVIPEHWRIMRLRYFTKDMVAGPFGSSLTKDLYAAEGYKVYGQEQVIPANFSVGDYYIPRDLYLAMKRYAVAPGDVLISCVGTFGKVAVVPPEVEPGIINPRLAKLVPKKDTVIPAYLGLLIKSQVVFEQMDQASHGGTMGIINLSLLSDLQLPLPSLAEQSTIVAFLNRETTKINALIARKEQLIELLQEKRTALISHAVTRGLDPTVQMKDSGVEWLGEIPAHWEVKRLKFCLNAIEQGWSPTCENRPAELDEWGVLKVGCVNGIKFNPYENKALPAETQPFPELEIKPGDVLVSRANTRELLGSASVVEQVRPHLLLCDKLYRLKILPGTITPIYLVLAMGSSTIRYQLERDATGASSSMQNISQSIILNLVISLPNIAEQSAIAAYLERETAKIDALISKIREGIGKLQEYSTSLISAAVTGKIDVRETIGDNQEY